MKPSNIWSGNNLLGRLNLADRALLAPHIRMMTCDSNSILYEPGQDVQTVYFPCHDTIMSFVVATDDGRAVETMLIGREGAVGGIVSQGRLPAYTRIMVQSAGQAGAIPVSALDAAKATSRSLDNLFARYADCMMAQIFQSTACNATHSIEERAAKWICAAAERTDHDDVEMTQDRLSAMLGVGRSYVSRVIRRYKDEGLVTVRRGHILIHDRPRLKQRACGCNEAVKEHFDVVLRGVYPSGPEDDIR